MEREDKLLLKTNLVVQEWKGIKYIRTRPNKERKSKTDKQVLIRAAFVKTQKLASLLLDSIIHTIWNPYASNFREKNKRQISGYLLFMRENTTCFNAASIDFKNLLVSLGSAQPTSNACFYREADSYTIIWDNKTISSSYDNDYLRLIAIDEACENVYLFMHEDIKRKDCEINLEILNSENKSLHFYIFFEDADKNGKSNASFSRSLYVESSDSLVNNISLA